MSGASETPQDPSWGRTGALTDLALTLPIFIGYHLGVVFLPVRNAADLVTQELVALARQSMLQYVGLALAIAAVFVGVLLVLGRGEALRWQRFALVALEGVLYAIAMRLVAGYVIGKLPLSSAVTLNGSFAGAVMALGAGFYEEIVFRVGLFALGARLLLVVFPGGLPGHRVLLRAGWGVLAAALFSGWHHFGAMGDAFDLRVFVFRWVCGVVFTVIYVWRGFAPAVWTHTLYDLWVLVT
jgi:hypothetical protein